ncbi:MAG: hypothetical protein IT307_16405 [Chloroflexi bacterium]|nr:hypothetical protein [Chloroflexota bacterium]
MVAGVRRLTRGRFIAGAAALSGLLSAPLGRAAAQDAKNFSLEVAWDGRTWRFDNGQSGPPARGWTFTVQGKLFPPGTFGRGGGGPDAPGTIGTCVSRGVLLVDAAEMVRGGVAQAMATHLLMFDETTMIVSEGMQGGGKFTRAIVGGTGIYLAAEGYVIEQPFGTNESMVRLGTEGELAAPNELFVVSLL